MKFSITTLMGKWHDLVHNADSFPDKMTKKQALELSIKKWQTIIEHLEENPQLNYIMRDGNIGTCALCSKFYGISMSINSRTGRTYNCKECPVYEKTGKEFCAGTPYVKFTDVSERSNVRHHEGKVACTPTMAKQRLEAAWAELNFLESLRK